MKKECLNEEIDITMIEKNGGSFIKTNLKTFLTLIHNLIDAEGFGVVSECFNCNRRKQVKRFRIPNGLCGGAKIDDNWYWDYCKKCAANHGLYLLKYVLGEKLR